jgi:hypothetical protein
MFIFLTLESIAVIGLLMVVTRTLRNKFGVLFPMEGTLFTLPVDKIDETKVTKEKKKDAKPELVDYEMAVVISNHENLRKHEGMGDYEFLTVLITTSLLAVATKHLFSLLEPLSPLLPSSSGFLEDQNIDLYLLAFVLLYYLAVTLKLLFRADPFRSLRTHSLLVAFLSVLLGLLVSSGFNRLFVGPIRPSIARFNMGLAAYLASIYIQPTLGLQAFVQPRSLDWVVVAATALLMMAFTPAMVKFVDCFQVQRKAIREYEQRLEQTQLDEKDRRITSNILLKFHKGYYTAICSLCLQLVAILLHFNDFSDLLLRHMSLTSCYLLLALIMLASTVLEAVSTVQEIKNKCQRVVEMFVGYKPKNADYKRFFIHRCYSFYKAAMLNFNASMIKSVLPFLLLLLMITLIRKERVYRGMNGLSNLSQLTTEVEPDLIPLLRQHYYCPLAKSSQIISIVKRFGIKQGTEIFNAEGSNPFTPSSEHKLNLGFYLNGLLLDVVRLVLLNTFVCKFLLQLGYIVVVTVTQEEVE